MTPAGESVESLSVFHPLVRSWFAATYPRPTDAQAQAWPIIAGGANVLVCAPTGSGKTLTAFLAAIDSLIRGVWREDSRPGVRVLYISPLKALNNDVRRNLLAPLDELRNHFAAAGEPFPDIAVMTRSGDTPDDERRRMVRSPPAILITTPESLNLMLTSRQGERLFGTLKVLILDEIHAVADSKRGTHLIAGVERLTLEAGEFQRVGLSATVRPPELIADWLGGYQRTEGGGHQKRPVTVIQSRDRRDLEVTIKTISLVASDESDEWWTRLSDELIGVINTHQATLIFANSRRMAEKLSRNINERSGGLLAYAHHGSLSKELRLSVEERLKKGELKAIVATSSLELGIDIGSLDKVVMVQTPFSVASSLQRIGRASHQVGAVSRADLVPIHGLDLVSATVLSAMALNRDIETLRPVENALDVLAQVLLSITCRETWGRDDLFDFIRCAWPYRNLPRRFFDLTVEMLAGRFADAPIRELRPRVEIDALAGTIRARDGTDFLIYQGGGTIPDRGYFQLRLADSKALVGELDEEFVWERNLGDQFTLGNNAWQIVGIRQNDVEVIPADPTRAIIPFWNAEEVDRNFFFSDQIGRFLARANEAIDRPEDFAKELVAAYPLNEAGAADLIRFLDLQREATGQPLPSRQQIVVEEVEPPAHSPRAKSQAAHGSPTSRPDVAQAVVHTFWGGKLNKPFALAFAAAWEQRYHASLEFFAGNECILFEFPEGAVDDSGRSIPLTDLLRDLVTSTNLETLLRQKLERTGLFGGRFRENAGRALLLPKGDARKRYPLWLTRLRSKKLLDAVMAYPDFPLVIETWRDCLEDAFDLDGLKKVLDEISIGTIAISHCRTTQPSPFADRVVWKQTNLYMYQDDTPLPGKISGLAEDLFAQLLADGRLRPSIPQALAQELTGKLQGTWPGYRPERAADLLLSLTEAGFMEADLWDDLAAGIEDLASIGDQAVRFHPEGSQTAWVVPTAGLPGVLRALGYAADRLPPDLPSTVAAWVATQLAGDEESFSGTAERLVGLWLGRRGPVTLGEISAVFAWPHQRLAEIIEVLVANQDLVSGPLLEGSDTVRFCDADNYERLLRLLRQTRRPVFQALPLPDLALFLADWQGILEPGAGFADLTARLDRLLAYPLAAELWEGAVLPARLGPYYPSWLDSLFASYGLAWQGTSEGRLAFLFEEDLGWLMGERRATAGSPTDSESDPFPPGFQRGALLDIANARRIDSAQATTELWQAAWLGRVSVDSFEAVRRGIRSNFQAEPLSSASTRGGYQRWERSRPTVGNWFRITAPKDPEEADRDAIDDLEQGRERVRQLLARYGILCRAILQHEAPAFRWGAVFRTLRLMELSGEVLAGHFFDGIEGLQFASPEALRRLESLGRNPDAPARDQVWWINAQDPASLCGSGLLPTDEIAPGGLPRRLASNWLVYQGNRLVMVVRRQGRELTINLTDDEVLSPLCFGVFTNLLGREFDPLTSVSVETINDQPAPKNSWLPAFKAFGFMADHRKLTLWRRH